MEFSSELVRDVWPEPEPVALLAGELRDISLDLCRRAKLIDSLQLKLEGVMKEDNSGK